MQHGALVRLAEQWDDAASSVLALEPLPSDELWQLLGDTYRELTAVHKDAKIPKEIAKILLNAEEFLYFASVMEDNEMGPDFYHWQAIRILVDALKAGFFKGCYDYAYPKLKVTDPVDNDFLVDFESDCLEAYAAAIQSAKAEEL